MECWIVAALVCAVFVVLMAVWRPSAPKDQTAGDPVWPDVQREPPPSE